MASGHERRNTWPLRPMLQNVRKFLPGRRPHVTRCRLKSESGHLECVAVSYRVPLDHHDRAGRLLGGGRARKMKGPAI
jgi:hypothetical protein